MYCTLLSEIGELNDLQKNSIDSFLQNFLSNGYITVSKAIEYTGMQDKIIVDTFSKLYLHGYLEIVHAIKCPECGHLIKKIGEIDYFDYCSVDSCYACDSAIEVSENDIVTLFMKKGKDPFVKGQHHQNNLLSIQEGSVAPVDSKNYLESISVIFSRIVSLIEKSNDSNQHQKQKMQKLRIKAGKRYRHNKKTYVIVSSVFRFISLFILLWLIYISKADSGVAVFVTVIIYAFQNVIDVILKNVIVTDFDEIERELLLLDIQKNEE